MRKTIKHPCIMRSEGEKWVLLKYLGSLYMGVLIIEKRSNPSVRHTLDAETGHDGSVHHAISSLKTGACSFTKVFYNENIYYYPNWNSDGFKHHLDCRPSALVSFFTSQMSEKLPYYIRATKRSNTNIY